ncbi:MAG TPA: hypothetical protein PKW41_14230 [Clostridia bacterium]|nr:hypothetical protein [Clostridia bacterium]HPK17148.1 hypothetical protein [Clostridia bacterium]
MIVINLRIYYPTLYEQDVLCEVPEQVKLLLDELKRLEHAQNERHRYHGEYLTFIEDVTDLELGLPSLEEAYLQARRKKALYKAMLKLPVKQMRRIYAYFFLQLSETEIARVEKVSIAAISSSITQGILHLREHLSKD